MSTAAQLPTLSMKAKHKILLTLLWKSKVFASIANYHITYIVFLPSEPPIFVTSPTNVTLMESSTLSLNCTVSGLPLPQITWRRTGQDGGQQQLTTDGNIRMEEEESQSIAGRKTSLLLIESVNFSHAGLYDCVASNFLGNVSSTQASITVYGTKNCFYYSFSFKRIQIFIY